MTESIPRPVLPARMETEFARLLGQLVACNHRPQELLARARLPRWQRRPLFFFLGYIAKAEGRVTEADISFAEELIRTLKFSARQRQRAITWFQQGKSATGLPALTGLGLRLSSRIRPAPAIRIALCLCHAAQLKGRPPRPRRYRCEDALVQMGLPASIADDILESYASRVWVRSGEIPETPATYDQACQLLGVTRRDSLPQIKRAYRRKVSACHPDKLAQQRIGPAERAAAKERLLRYQQAWELIKRRHDLTR